MGEIKYYQDLRNNLLLAYEKSVAFFVMYVPETNEWTDCNISFSAFQHDYAYREIIREEALKITNGNLPDAMFRQYLDILRKNRGELD